jgi:hypothetical protein
MIFCIDRIILVISQSGIIKFMGEKNFKTVTYLELILLDLQKANYLIYA